MDRLMGKTLIAVGSIIVLVGVIILFRDQVPGLRHLGRLPGDMVIQRKNFSLYFPLATSIVISIVLSVLIYLFNKFR